MDPLQRLLIEDACRSLVLRAAALADAHDAEGFSALFAADAVLQRPNAAPLAGRDAIRDAYAQRPRSRITRHLVSNTRITVESATQARGHSLVLLWSGSSDDAAGAQGRPARGPALVGEFDDRFVLGPDGWCIARREASFVLHAPLREVAVEGDTRSSLKITGTTRVFYILGDPVAQVRAPEVYNHLFQQHGIDAVLVPLKLPAAALPGFLAHGLKADNIGGCWATMPHKGQLAALLKPVDPVARIAGAVNAVRRLPDGKLEAALFDGIGFVKGLDHFGIDVQGKRVLVVGAGGGGHAVAAAIAQRGPALLAVFNRTRERAAALVERLQPLVGDAARVADSADPGGFDLVVNCTSQGLKPDDPLPFDAARVDAGAAVVDIIMSKQPTPLLRECRARGLKAEAGFEMLVQQVPEYLRFFGFDALAKTLQSDLGVVRSLLYPQ
jgi:shikimate dehydrogenase